MGGHTEGERGQTEGTDKVRLIAKGFQEEESPQSDSSTMLRDSLKSYFVLAANQRFDLRSISTGKDTG